MILHMYNLHIDKCSLFWCNRWCIVFFRLLTIEKLMMDGLNIYAKRKFFAWLFFAHVLELKMIFTSQGFRKMVSLTKGGHMAPTHCTGVSQFLLETSDVHALSNHIFVEYYNLNFLFMTIMTCVPPSLNIFCKSQNVFKSKI